MKVLDRVFSLLLILGGVGHTIGSFVVFGNRPEELLWSLCTSLFIFLLGAVNVLRAGRPRDAPLAWIAVCFNVLWLMAGIQFGYVIHNMLDLRVSAFAVITIVLTGLSLHTMVHGKRTGRMPIE